MLNSSAIKNISSKIGFDLCGITVPRDFGNNRKHYEEWLALGYGEPLEYMQKYLDVRFDPSMLLDGCKSVIVCAVNYKNINSLGSHKEDTPNIASYAFSVDYHKTIRRMLKSLLREIQATDPSVNGRCCVDTAPLLEKQLAYEAGLGWIGRQSLLITPQFGSFVCLGVLLLDKEVDTYNKPIQGISCGTCHKCVDACPNGAINNNRTIDTRLCISCRTIECEESNNTPLNGWIFGCDECQRCCPHNQSTPLYSNADFTPLFQPLNSDKWLQMEEVEFTKMVGRTAIKRSGLERIKSNIKKTVK